MCHDPKRDSIFKRLNAGDAAAHEELMAEVYGILRTIAAGYMAREPDCHTLQTTALVNEAYARIFRNQERVWEDRAHFLKLAATAMRTILVDHARRKQADKRSPRGDRINLDDVLIDFENRSHGLIDLDAALVKLADEDPQLVRLIELRFFAGCTMEEAAASLDISERNAYRKWKVARAWLARELSR